jgi:hypothetical protein
MLTKGKGSIAGSFDIYFLQVHLTAHRHLCFFSRQNWFFSEWPAHGLLQILKLKINSENNSIHAPTNKLLTGDLGKERKVS